MEARDACSKTSCDKSPGVADKFAHFIFASRKASWCRAEADARPPPRQTYCRNNAGYRHGFMTPSESELIFLVQNKI